MLSSQPVVVALRQVCAGAILADASAFLQMRVKGDPGQEGEGGVLII